jgi:CRP-like cAMP-binding protein
MLPRLSKIPLFDDLPEDQLASLASWLDEEGTKAGHGVTHEGTSGYAFFVIEEGQARVLHGDEELRRLGRGDFFGEAAILGDGRRTADVVAETDLELLAHVRHALPGVADGDAGARRDDRSHHARAARPVRLI